MARMEQHFLTLLKGIATDPGQRLSDLPLLTQAEQHQLLVEWNKTQSDYQVWQEGHHPEQITERRDDVAEAGVHAQQPVGTRLRG